MPRIVGPDIVITGTKENDDDDMNRENGVRHRQQKMMVPEHDTKRSSGVEPMLDPTTVLTALVANSNGQLPPYQL